MAFQVTRHPQLSDALAATELVLTPRQHLTQLDGPPPPPPDSERRSRHLPDLARTGTRPCPTTARWPAISNLAGTGAALP